MEPLSRQYHPPGADPYVPPKGLPRLKLPWNLRSPAIPQSLGWVNPGAAATARILGFPDPSRDTELRSRSRRTASGGWLVQLTDTPLDLDHPSHVDALPRTYERFPEIGGRVSATPK